MAKIQINNEVRDMTPAEEEALAADYARYSINIQAEKDAKAQKAIDKTNGNQKLLDLGLTQAEVDAITGQ